MAEQNNRLKVDSSPHSRVFAELCRLLREDKDLKRVVKTFRLWDGEETSDDDWSAGLVPGVRLTPSLGPDQFYGPSGFRTPLACDLEVAAQGTFAADAMDL